MMLINKKSPCGLRMGDIKRSCGALGVFYVI